MNEKDFSEWSKLKPKIHKKEVKDVYFYEREIWFVSCGVNIGFEQDGKGELFSRPVVILKKFNPNIFWGIPLSKALKEGKYYLPFQYNSDLQSCAILSQLRLFDANRLIRKDGKIPEEKFHELKEKIRKLI